MQGIYFHSEGTVKNPLSGKQKIYKQWLQEVAKKEEGCIQEIHYIFCDDSYILEMNKNYLNHDYYTDIITFPYSHDKKDIKADIYISVDTVASNAEQFNVTFDNELNRVIVHGLLHMLGYQDKSDEQALVMREKENYYISQFPATIPG